MDACAAGVPRPHGTAAVARGDRDLREGCGSGRVPEIRGSPAWEAAVRRAPRALLAGCGALRGHPRAALRQLPRDVGVSRLGHRRVQFEPAVRQIHDRADRRRPVAGCDGPAESRNGIPPLQHDDERGWHDRSRESRRLRPRPRRDDFMGVARAHRELRRLPRSQVRSHHNAGLLRDVRIFPKHDAGRIGRQFSKDRPRDNSRSGRGRRATGRAAEGNRGGDREAGRASGPAAHGV